MKYARTITSCCRFDVQQDLHRFQPSVYHIEFDRMTELGEAFLKLQPDTPQIYYIWGHSYEFDNNDNWDVIENFCKYMGGRDDIWYATNIEIIDYMDAAKRLQFSADYEKVYNPNACSVWLQLNSDKCVEIEGGTLVDLNTLL